MMMSFICGLQQSMQSVPCIWW